MKARLNAAEAAEFLGYSTKTMSNMRGVSTGPDWYKIGGRVWYDLADLVAYVDKCKAETLVRH